MSLSLSLFFSNLLSSFVDFPSCGMIGLVRVRVYVWDVFRLNFQGDFPRNWEKLVFVICFGRFSLPAGCVVLLCFFSPHPCAMWLVSIFGLFGGFLIQGFF